MRGATDLAAMLADLTVSRRPGTFVVTSVGEPVALGSGVHAVIAEAEGVTVVADREVAERNGWSCDFECAWLTLDVHSALEAVGLTAAVSRALADRGIACNVVAGYFHDHLLVPLASADAAVAALTKAAAPAAPAITLEELIGLETAVWRALQAGDRIADLDLLAEDFVGLYPTGFADRDDHARQLDAGPTVGEFEIAQARLLSLGDTHAMLCYRADYRRPGPESPTESMYVSSLWAWRSGRWLNVFSQDCAVDATSSLP